MRMIALALALGVFVSTTPSAWSVRQGQLDFTILNSTGLLILELHVSPDDANDWREDLLGLEQLKQNATAHVTTSRPETSCNWDLKIKKVDGDEVEWDSLDLCAASHVTLLYENGTPTAVVN